MQELAGCPWTPAFAGVTVKKKRDDNPNAIALPLKGARDASAAAIMAMAERDLQLGET